MAELQVADEAIVEIDHRHKRDGQVAFAAKGQCHSKTPSQICMQVPELMLEDDGHLFGVAFTQFFQESNTGIGGQKGDKKMSFAGQAVFLRDA